jgi:hypothetical protein
MLDPMHPVREANRLDALKLIPKIPAVIPGSNKRTCPENLRWLMERVISEIDTFPLDKMGRWIGFVQGVLALSNNLDVDDTRNESREIYHQAYIATGQAVPRTMEMGDGVTKEKIMAQVQLDKLAFAALSPEKQAQLTKQVEFLRRPSHTNFSDPEVL